MSMPQDRLSTVPVPAPFLPPDERDTGLLTDSEAGPIAINDTSEGMFFQPWTLEYNESTDDFVLTPENVGSPVVVLNAPDVTQCVFCFDQNARVTVAYTTDVSSFLYWYDSFVASFVTTDLGADVVRPTLTLDDKRQTMNNINDMLLYYTKESGGEYFAFHRRQRDRFGVEIPLNGGQPVPPYIRKCGMHEQLRVQLSYSDVNV